MSKSAEADKPKKKKTKLIVIIGLVAVLGIGAKVMLPKLTKPAKVATKPAASVVSTKPGAVLKEDSITINLAGGHYLRIGVALQLPLGVAETDVDGSRALNTTIEMLSGQTMDNLSGTHRTAIINKLDKAIVSAYGTSTVTSVYLTDFVMQ